MKNIIAYLTLFYFTITPLAGQKIIYLTDNYTYTGGSQHVGDKIEISQSSITTTRENGRISKFSIEGKDNSGNLILNFHGFTVLMKDNPIKKMFYFNYGDGSDKGWFYYETQQEKNNREKKERIEAEKKNNERIIQLRVEEQQNKLKSDRELSFQLNKLNTALIAKDTLTMIYILNELKNSELINVNENTARLQQFNEIRNVYEKNAKLEKERIEKEKERLRLENERIKKELEDERLRLENEQLEKQRIIKYTENTIKFKHLEIANMDFPNFMKWDEATKACSSLGNGWRLPTYKELQQFYTITSNENKDRWNTKYYYWSSKESNDRYYEGQYDVDFALVIDLLNHKKKWLIKNSSGVVRAVRSF